MLHARAIIWIVAALTAMVALAVYLVMVPSGDIPTHDAPLRDTPPQAVAPQDIPPREAMVMNLETDFNPSGWCGKDLETHAFCLTYTDGMARMQVNEAKSAKSFHRYLTVRVDPQKYPLLKVRYRATGMWPEAPIKLMWLSAYGERGTSSATPFSHDQAIPDGKVHELACDLRQFDFQYPGGKVESGPSGVIYALCFYIGANDDGAATFDLLDVRFEADKPNDPVPDDESITVRVTCNGQPVAGASVMVDHEWLNVSRTATTNSDGEAVVTPRVTVGGKHTLMVDADGCVPMRDFDVRGSGPIDVALHKGEILSAVVHNDYGKPIEGATVQGTVMWPGRRSRTVRVRSQFIVLTDAAGRWTSPLMPVDIGRIVVKLAHRDYASDARYADTVKATTDQLIAGNSVAVMARGFTVTGFVVDAEGSPVSGAMVRRSEDIWGAHHPATQTDADGQFTLRHYPSGPATVRVEARGHGPGVGRFIVSADMQPPRIDLPKSHTIRGRVVDADDKPVADATVIATGWGDFKSPAWRTRTDDEGRFAWTDAPPQSVTFDITRSGQMSVRDLTLPPSDDEHLIAMSNLLRISGDVRDADTEALIETFTLVPGIRIDDHGKIRWERHLAKTFTAGRYAMTFNAPSNGRVVRIDADGYLPAVSRQVANDEGDVTIAMLMKKGAAITGIVREPSGAPASHATIAIATTTQGANIRNGREVEGSHIPSISTDTDGRYKLPPQVERYAIAVMSDEGYACVLDEQLKPSPDITLQAWSRVEGVYKVGAKPGSNTQIRLYPRWFGDYDMPAVFHGQVTTTDDQGRFAFDRVPPGAGAVRAYVFGSANAWSDRQTRRYDVLPAQTATMHLGGVGRPVIGRIALPPDVADGIELDDRYHYVRLKLDPPFGDGSPLPLPADAEAIEAWRNSNAGKAYMEYRQRLREYHIRLKKDGTFRIEDLAEGTYEMTVVVSPKRKGNTGEDHEPPVASLECEFTVPPIEGGRSDEPLDLGVFELKLISDDEEQEDAAPLVSPFPPDMLL